MSLDAFFYKQVHVLVNASLCGVKRSARVPDDQNSKGLWGLRGVKCVLQQLQPCVNSQHYCPRFSFISISIMINKNQSTPNNVKNPGNYIMRKSWTC